MNTDLEQVRTEISFRADALNETIYAVRSITDINRENINTLSAQLQELRATVGDLHYSLEVKIPELLESFTNQVREAVEQGEEIPTLSREEFLQKVHDVFGF